MATTSEDETLYSATSNRMIDDHPRGQASDIFASSSVDKEMSNAPVAGRTCRSCKKRKKRCDKLLPSCSTCKATHTVCEYKDEIISPDELRILELQRRLDTLENMLLLSEKAGHPNSGYATVVDKLIPYDPHMSHPLLSRVATKNYPEDIDQFAQEFVSKVIDDYGQPSQPALRAFFDEVQQWLPIIDEKSFNKHFSDAEIVPRADRSLLFLTVYLLGQPPRIDAATEQSILHCNTRAFFQYLSKRLHPSIELVQSALLLATYEHTRGLVETAYTTISSAASMAHAIGLPSAARRHYAPFDGSADSSASSKSNLWWAIVVLDRFIKIEDEMHDRPFVSEPVYVRQPKSLYDHYKTGSGPVNNPDSSAQELPSNDLRRQFLACDLLSRVFEFCSRADAAANEHQMTVLDYELKVFFNDILQDYSARWGMMSAATALWNLAFITLHDSSLLGIQGSSLFLMDPRSSLRTTLSLTTATRIVIDIVKAYHENKVDIPAGSLSPGCAFTVYKAGVLHLRSYTVGDEQWWAEFNSIRQFCWCFGQRWPLAAKYLGLLENEASKVIPTLMGVTEVQ